ncbi:hypothetical protein SISSUDRAFT_994894 [Sistotremastrum suecicum HHB10207 ss-3]|uniref:Tc1-like transposase DDE domain-containing protein n=1 Tax=Sistotremastrum suecicum HHB10207 ss-3 TaxID=1314776 RepID=A0A165WWW7_9AGAM|nr:hypothetical protein SISSUDRAFT_994894 [Sistotremastrum suecicum HHB10207 ss-3]
MKCEFLPPYSPDMNPIELAFSAMKYHLRRDGDRLRESMRSDANPTLVYHCLRKALWEISSKDAFGWFKYCGYCHDESEDEDSDEYADDLLSLYDINSNEYPPEN